MRKLFRCHISRTRLRLTSKPRPHEYPVIRNAEISVPVHPRTIRWGNKGKFPCVFVHNLHRDRPYSSQWYAVREHFYEKTYLVFDAYSD
jgi:hypothetical protein